jgi:hypothetical protein
MYNHILFTKLFCTDKEYINRLEIYKVYRNVLLELISNKEKYIVQFINDVYNITGVKFDKLEPKFLDNIIFYNNLRYSEEHKVEFIYIIKELLNKIEMNIFSTNRIFYSMVIFKLLDTKFGADFTNSYKRFKNVVDSKIIEFQNQPINSEFIKYIKDNYVVNRKYISKEKNKIYYKSLLKTTLFSLFAFNSLYKKIKNKGNYKCIIS